MKQCLLTVISVNEIASQTYEMKLSTGDSIDQIMAGQFLHIQVGNGVHALRRPISIANYDENTATVTIVFKRNGEGTKHLSEYQPGESLDTLFPCGSGYPLENLTINKALLIGGGIGVPPLYYLARKLKEKGIQVTSYLGFQSADQIFYQEKFSKLGETFVITQDGSNGSKGLVTDLIAGKSYDYDCYFTCGPTGMLKAVSSQLEEKQGYISVEQRMGCGIGACYACVIPSNSDDSGFKKICKDGPVFAAKEVVL